jgi:pyrimidine deaminase RibD-like protein
LYVRNDDATAWTKAKNSLAILQQIRANGKSIDDIDLQGVAEGSKQNYLSQIPNLAWKPVSRSVWNTIQDEGLDEEQDAPNHSDWVMANLTISPKDSHALQAFDNDAIEDFNKFDIHLKSRYPGLTDLIDYDRGTVTIVKTVTEQSVAEGRKKKKKKTSRHFGGYFFPGYGYYGSGESGEGGGEGESVAEGAEQPDLMSAFRDFLPIAMRELDIDKLPPIRLLKQVPAGDQPTFGKFNNQENVIHLGIAERHPIDILRTLAHELVHYKQNTEHQLAAGSGKTGSPEENQAHEIAGVVMRDFNKSHPEYFAASAVELTEDRSDYEIRNRAKLDNILVNLCRHVVEGQRVDPSKYGMVAACVVDPDNRQVIGVNELTADGTRKHGERVAMERYQAQYGDIPEGSIIVTTCSPCNEEHMTERYGESCTDIINNSNCRKVYCGYQDPSQTDEHNEFTMEVTGNADIVGLCEHFAATFLNENFADGKGPGRPGDSVRHGIPKNATMAELERASRAKGRKGQLARWQLNMRRGRKK